MPNIVALQTLFHNILWSDVQFKTTKPVGKILTPWNKSNPRPCCIAPGFSQSGSGFRKRVTRYAVGVQAAC